HVRDQQAHGLGAFRAQGAGLGVGDKVQPLGRGQHALSRLGGDGTVAGQGAGGRAKRDARLGGDVLDGGTGGHPGPPVAPSNAPPRMETFPYPSVAASAGPPSGRSALTGSTTTRTSDGGA